jgi:aminoglycoside phosphotransferase (APT) family kinase protein
VTAAPVSVDADRLLDWAGDRLPGTGAVTLTRMGQHTGAANALFFVDRGGVRSVLRRPPAVVNTTGASDVSREWRLLQALAGTPVPHPEPLALCEDLDVIGAPFLLMGLVEGFTPVGELPAPYDVPARRRALSFAMVDAIADLSEVDWRARGLDGLGRPDGFLERQVPRWLRQLDSYRTRDVPGADAAAAWLEQNRPPARAAGIMHGDYSTFNVMASWTDPTRLAAVIDWDTGTVGDPLLDLGHLLARWTQDGEEPVLVPLDIRTRDGLPTRAQLADRYAERTGADLSHLTWYEVLSLFKLAVILEGGVGRTRAAGDHTAADERAATVDRLLHYAMAFARGERS